MIRRQNIRPRPAPSSGGRRTGSSSSSSSSSSLWLSSSWSSSSLQNPWLSLVAVALLFWLLISSFDDGSSSFNKKSGGGALHFLVGDARRRDVAAERRKQLSYRYDWEQCYITAEGPGPMVGAAVGHQLESRLTCMATAIDLGLAYVHTRLAPASAEDLLGITQAIQRRGSRRNNNALPPEFTTWNEEDMETLERRPVQTFGRCQQPSWFYPEVRQQQCRDAANDPYRSKLPVFAGDHCWDYFWCQLAHNRSNDLARAWQEELAPPLRQLLLQRSKQQQKQQRNHNDESKLWVVLYLQLKSSSSTWINLVFRELYLVAPGALRITIHADGTADQVMQFLDLDHHPKPFEGHEIIGTDHPDYTIDNTTTTNNNNIALLAEHALADMVLADLYVASPSALAVAAGLLRQGPVIYPPEFDRRGMYALGWHMLKLWPNHVREYNGHEFVTVDGNTLFREIVQQANHTRRQEQQQRHRERHRERQRRLTTATTATSNRRRLSHDNRRR